MPNWCNNNIEVRGPIEKIKALYNEAVQDADNETGLLNHMVPMPVELHGTTSPSDSPNWYDWRVSNWSTKWEVSSEGLEFTDNGDGTGTVSGWFDSAWAPPINAYNTYLENNEDCSITATFYEPGMDFAGEYEDGMIDECEDLHSEYSKPEDQQSDLYKRLDEEFGLSESFEMWDEEEAV